MKKRLELNEEEINEIAHMLYSSDPQDNKLAQAMFDIITTISYLKIMKRLNELLPF